MSLPWDTYHPEDDYVPPPTPVPAPAPEVTYEESSSVDTARVPLDFDFKASIKDAIDEAMQDVGPQIKERVTGYARDSWDAFRAGKSVDHSNPTITAETSSGHELVVADARSRSLRTLLQGLTIDVIFAVVAGFTMIADMDPFVKETWITLGILLIKSVLSAVVSYFMRLKITPTMRVPGEKMAVMPIPRPMIHEG